ncbi:hypothetical protein [Streptomyces sp. NPDC057694]|uniref:hypothetical protein n=1 Tax=Streptomyces sp. NPDC057694 TaxID=3346216 RepID=UPI00367C5D47
MLALLWAVLGAVFDAVMFLVAVSLAITVPGAIVWSISESADPRDALRVRRFLNRALDLAEFAGLVLLTWVYERTLGRPVGAYLRRSRRKTAQHLAWAKRPFGPDADRLFPVGRHVRAALRAWHQAAPLAAAAYLAKVFLLLQILLNLGRLVDAATRWASHVWAASAKALVPWWAPGGGLWGPTRQVAVGTAQPPVDVEIVATLRVSGEAIWSKATQYLPALAAPEERSNEATIAVSGLVLLLALILAFRAVRKILGRRPGPVTQGGGHKRSPGFIDRFPRGWWLRSLLSLRPGAASRVRPVAVLVDCVARVGAARRYYQTDSPPRRVLDTPRVDLSEVESVVWSAWKIRHRPMRGTQRREYRKHAAHVVGAIRQLETRQDLKGDTGQVFEDMTRLLVKIADRYAEGSTLSLLDPEDLDGIDPVVNREWVRLIVLGVVMAGAAIAAGLSDLSAAGSTQIVAVVGAVAWALLYRDRLMPGDVLDVLRGQSRK